MFAPAAADPCLSTEAPPLSNGTITCAGTSVQSGGTCTVTCDKGYSPAPATVRCAAGKFSSATCRGEQLVCLRCMCVAKWPAQCVASCHAVTAQLCMVATCAAACLATLYCARLCVYSLSNLQLHCCCRSCRVPSELGRHSAQTSLGTHTAQQPAACMVHSKCADNVYDKGYVTRCFISLSLCLSVCLSLPSYPLLVVC